MFIILITLLLIACSLSSQGVYPQRITINGDTVVVITDAHVKALVAVMIENEHNVLLIDRYRALSVINDSIISNRDEALRNRDYVVDAQRGLIMKQEQQLKRYRRKVTIERYKGYLMFGSGVLLGVAIKALL